MVLDESTSISISSIENILKNYKYIPLDKDDLIDLKTGPQKLKIFSEKYKKNPELYNEKIPSQSKTAMIEIQERLKKYIDDYNADMDMYFKGIHQNNYRYSKKNQIRPIEYIVYNIPKNPDYLYKLFTFEESKKKGISVEIIKKIRNGEI